MTKKKGMKRKSSFKLATYTKRWVTIILVIALVDMQLPFILAFLDKTEIAESLATAIVTEIIAVILGYMAKSFFETRESEKNKITMRELNSMIEDNREDEE